MREKHFRLVFILFLFVISQEQWAQQEKFIVKGEVTGSDNSENKGQLYPLIGANVYWAGTTKGTITGSDGKFSIESVPGYHLLVISFTGYKADTLHVHSDRNLKVRLKESVDLDEVHVIKRQGSTTISHIDPIKIERINEAEFLKAACCNLSESFETNPSVDVSFTDAITGTRQIQMLGLAGPYSQITRENMPDIRGLSAIYGLTYIPGTWVESLQLNKGTGSVVNGFESIAGQINVELRKPEDAERLYLNLFANEDSRLEANINLAQRFSDYTSAGLLLHAKNQSVKMDRNKDGFVDHPVGEQYILLNRWKLHFNNGWRSQFGIKGTYIKSTGGEMDYDPENTSFLETHWGMEMLTKRAEGWLKVGKVYPDKNYQSLGIQLSGMHHDQDSKFGLKEYSGSEQMLYGNFIFQSILGTTAHKFKTGASVLYDSYSENLDSLKFERIEFIPGVFFEYTYSWLETFNVVAGLRLDHHNNYGIFITPRVHGRYALDDFTVIRISAGRGQRTASIIAENNAVLASSRIFQVTGATDYGYGLKPEIAWNFGTNLTRKFRLDYRDGAISFDLYHTIFRDQVIIDLDENPQLVHFYNLDGRSYSTSFQSQIDYELLRRLDVRLAYRWFDVQTEYQSGLKTKPLVARHRAFINLAYHTRNNWKFDYTVQWQGKKRIPNTTSNPPQYRISDHSPSFFLMNAQISRSWNNKFEIYLGAENLLDFKQEDPIIASDDPFGPYFDSSMIWGPVFGRMVYAGIRYRVK